MRLSLLVLDVLTDNPLDPFEDQLHQASKRKPLGDGRSHSESPEEFSKAFHTFTSSSFSRKRYQYHYSLCYGGSVMGALSWGCAFWGGLQAYSRARCAVVQERGGGCV